MQKIEMHNSENIDNTSLKKAMSYNLDVEEITAKNILCLCQRARLHFLS